MVLKVLFGLLALVGMHTQSYDEPPIKPTVDLSTVRSIYCYGEDGMYSGTGFLVGPHQMVTAFHVAEGKWMHMPKTAPYCQDMETKTQVVVYKLDAAHDIALMTGPGLPTDVPYIKYSCRHPKNNEPVLSYGITGYGEARDILRMNTLHATDKMSSTLDMDSWVDGIPSPGMRIYTGENAPGSSGGPIVDLNGYAIAINDAGGDGGMQNYDIADGMLCKK